MPIKSNATRRHRIPRARYRVRNWPAYEAALRRRGDLTLWIDEATLDGWLAPRRTTPGGQAIYSDLAIEMVLILRMVFHLALCQAETFAGSVFRLLELDLCVPDHTTLSRRSGSFANRRPSVISHGARHLIVDSTGLKLFGQGEWNEERHGRSRRSWRKLHLAVDACTGEIVANALTDNGADDAREVPGLLEQVDGKIASFIADGAYDGDPVYQAVARPAGRRRDPSPRIGGAVHERDQSAEPTRPAHPIDRGEGPYGLAEGDWLRPTQPRGNDNRSVQTNDRIEAAGSWHGCSTS
jgi:hypothetical protein